MIKSCIFEQYKKELTIKDYLTSKSGDHLNSFNVVADCCMMCRFVNDMSEVSKEPL